MGARVIVLVSDRDDPKHGEVSVLDDGRKAERLVETLLEAGFERERIRIFSGTEMDMQISHRPVVSLLGEEVEESTPGFASPAEEEETEPEAVPSEREGEEETTPATAWVQNGVRFSSLFRPA